MREQGWSHPVARRPPATYVGIDPQYGLVSNAAGGIGVAFIADTTSNGLGVWLEQGLGEGIQLTAYRGDLATGSTARLNYPNNIALDANGNLVMNDLNIGLSTLPAGGSLTNIAPRHRSRAQHGGGTHDGGTSRFHVTHSATRKPAGTPALPGGS